MVTIIPSMPSLRISPYIHAYTTFFSPKVEFFYFFFLIRKVITDVHKGPSRPPFDFPPYTLMQNLFLIRKVITGGLKWPLSVCALVL